MQGFLPDQNITLTFDVSSSGMEIVSVDYAVFDNADVQVVSRRAIAGVTSATTEVAVTILAVNNALPVGQTIASRVVTLWITGTGLSAGTVTQRASYVLLALDRLPVPSLSFQSLAAADMIAYDLAKVPSWGSATDSQKINAMLEARNRLVRLRYSWTPGDWQNRVSPYAELVDERLFNEMTELDWADLDAQFKVALQRAQVLEAESLLTVDSDAEYRAAGVVSVTIGESSRTFLRSMSGSAKLPVCARAMKVLSRYLAAPGLTRT